MQSSVQEVQLALFDQAARTIAKKPKTKPSAPSQQPNCSEICLTGQSQHCLFLLAPVLKLLSEQSEERWLTLVSPPAMLTMHWLRQAGLNPERTLILHPKGMQSSHELARRALETGCSHTVVSWLPKLTTSAQRRLSQAAVSGNAQSININQTFQPEKN